MKIEKFAGIDIGSNAVRLLIMNVYEYEGRTYFNKNILVRAPVRLGSDSFVHNEIQPDTLQSLANAMISFNHLMKCYQVKSYRACATSALREALNKDYVVEYIKTHTDIDIELIAGHEEADIIYNTQISQFLEENTSYLFIDVGGGSTELTYFRNKKVVFGKSFKIGSVRSLKNLVQKKEWDELSEFLLSHNIDAECFAVGTGGNINTLFKKSLKPLGKPLSLKYLKGEYDQLADMTVDERIIHYGFNPDRADVIVPALDIYIRIMKLVGIKQILVPKIGLADGLVRETYLKYKNSEDANQLKLPL